MNSILIANSAPKNQNYLKDLVSSGDCETLDFASSGSEARRMVIDADYEFGNHQHAAVRRVWSRALRFTVQTLPSPALCF